MTGFFLCPIKREGEMKMIIAVLVVRAIINMIEKIKMLPKAKTIAGTK
jgi:hypothetical protein